MPRIESYMANTARYSPITTTSPASDYWGIDLSVAYGTTSILDTTAGILDTGTTLILIASGTSRTVPRPLSTHPPQMRSPRTRLPPAPRWTRTRACS